MTLVPDLYRGKTTENYEEAGHMMATLDYPGALTDIQGAAKYLLSRGCRKVIVYKTLWALWNMYAMYMYTTYVEVHVGR